MGHQTFEIKVEGMTCVNCAASVSKFLERKGLQNVQVDFASGEVRFENGAGGFDLEEIKSGISRLGYAVRGEKKENFWSLEKKLVIAALFTVPLFLLHAFHSFGIESSFLHNHWFQLLLCLPVFLIGIVHFGKSALASVKNGSPNMDVLIFTGSTAAFVYSLIGTIEKNSDYIFYETAAMIITLVLLGNWLEKRAVKQTTSAIEDLSRLKPETAKKVMPSGTVVSIMQEDIQKDDLLQVNTGDQIPTDGIITETASFVRVDESMFTGESIPVEKSAGEQVLGGSLLINGNLQMKATANPKKTLLNKIIELIKSAQHEKSESQILADKISAIFVPGVLLISILTFIVSTIFFDITITKALMNSIAVLVISCPCAMGLATPTAVMVGVGRMAKNGILVKGGKTLETFAGIKNFVFDKTGTITTGRFKIKYFEVFGDHSENELKNMIITMESRSSHPIAESIVKEFSQNHKPEIFPFSEINEQKGMGINAKDYSGNYYELGFNYNRQSQKSEIKEINFFINKKLAATIGIQDELKTNSKEIIQYLKSKNRQIFLLSGDNISNTKKIAGEVGIEKYFAEKLPDEKLNLIEKFSQEAPTAMVGDGINDAPALAKATIGVSLSDASKIAIKSAQIILLNGKLDSLIQAHQISTETLRTIRQNLFWAFSYNIVAIPIAALGFLNPMWGALFMAFSDVVVIGNSLRLRTKKLGK